ncbi:hypothetical protein SOCE26_064230 [Sorangium cellulosum]|uniref:Uncharacterized protein n=1 Tax=Sorangium cellulosum TaxID=56 RepID=A0A2L0F093_SORCE|nr:hypothetical protein [Sorangium cellulosum]AUX44953.1 hypothetical protein SOCE26_064230 [Sorangium cellulosum]
MSAPRSTSPRAPRRPAAPLLAAPPLAAALLLAAACIERGYPLAASGQVDIRADVAGPLFAADTLDVEGKPVPPRQSPWRTAVSLQLTETNEPAYGAYVEVRVVPSEALALHAVDDETGDGVRGDGETGDETDDGASCSVRDGAFRCVAGTQGYARFIAASEGDWSGEARLVVAWADRTEELPITVLPAGLPEDATNFALIAGGLGENDRVLATYLPLTCTIGPLPDDLGATWRPGAIRAREARVRASPPQNAPGVVEHAPVIVESLHSEAALSLAPDCSERTTRLRVLLGATGESPPFTLCFSDLGGDVRLAVSSGQKVIEPAPALTVDPEPRLLRVRALRSVVTAGTPGDLFEVSAYNAKRVRIAVPVDLRAGDDRVIALGEASVTLRGEDSEATIVQGVAVAPGTTELRVTPRLLASPECTSEPVTVVAPPPPPPDPEPEPEPGDGGGSP